MIIAIVKELIKMQSIPAVIIVVISEKCILFLIKRNYTL
jgi:hypothetical protein